MKRFYGWVGHVADRWEYRMERLSSWAYFKRIGKRGQDDIEYPEVVSAAILDELRPQSMVKPFLRFKESHDE